MSYRNNPEVVAPSCDGSPAENLNSQGFAFDSRPSPPKGLTGVSAMESSCLQMLSGCSNCAKFAYILGSREQLSSRLPVYEKESQCREGTGVPRLSLAAQGCLCWAIRAGAGGRMLQVTRHFLWSVSGTSDLFLSYFTWLSSSRVRLC